MILLFYTVHLLVYLIYCLFVHVFYPLVPLCFLCFLPFSPCYLLRLFDQRLPRLLLPPCLPIRGTLPRVLLLRACKKHHHLLPRPHVLDDGVFVHVWLQRLEPRLVLLCSNCL